MIRVATGLVLAVLWTTGVAADPSGALRESIAHRLSLMEDVARFKWNHALPVADPEREQALIERNVGRALELGLDPDDVRRVLRAQLAASRLLQESLIADWQQHERPRFEPVLDLATEQRPRIERATEDLLRALVATRETPRVELARALEPTPPQLERHADAWALAIAPIMRAADEAPVASPR
jgi:chorismate mutase